MSPDDLHALQLLAELQRLTDPTQPTAIRITIRSAEGDYIGEAALPAPGVLRATQAVSAVADYKERAPQDFTPAGADGLDPQLVADLTDMYDAIDLVALTQTVLNAAAPTDRLTVTQAIDGMFGHIPHPGAEDGDL